MTEALWSAVVGAAAALLGAGLVASVSAWTSSRNLRQQLAAEAGRQRAALRFEGAVSAHDGHLGFLLRVEALAIRFANAEQQRWQGIPGSVDEPVAALLDADHLDETLWRVRLLAGPEAREQAFLAQQAAEQVIDCVGAVHMGIGTEQVLIDSVFDLAETRERYEAAARRDVGTDPD